MSKMTAYELFALTVDENEPIDYSWIRHIDRTYTDKDKRYFCRECVANCAPSGTSKNMIGRAATELYYYLF